MSGLQHVKGGEETENGERVCGVSESLDGEIGSGSIFVKSVVVVIVTVTPRMKVIVTASLFDENVVSSYPPSVMTNRRVVCCGVYRSYPGFDCDFDPADCFGGGGVYSSPSSPCPSSSPAPSQPVERAAASSLDHS